MTTYYVSPSGNDSTGTGAIGSPWQTPLKGLNTVPVGAHILQLRAGTYGNFFKQGRDTIIVENYPGENVIIQRTSVGVVVALENCRNVTLRRNASGGSFTIRSTVAGNGQGAGIQSAIAGGGSPGFVPSGLTIDGLIITDIAGRAIYCISTSNVEIKNCDISHSAGGPFLRLVTTFDIHDNVIHHIDRMLVSDVTPTDNDGGAIGVGLDFGTNAGYVQRNLIYECHAPSIDYGFDGGAVESFGNFNCIVQDNICFNNEGFYEDGTNNATTYPGNGNIVRRNLIYGRLSYKTTNPSPGVYHRAGDLQFYNNTFDVDDGTSIFTWQGAYPAHYASPMTNTKIKNNIFVSRNAATDCLQLFNVSGISGVEVDYNLLYNSTGGSAIVADSNNYGGTRAGTALAAWKAASPFSDHDVWNDNPDFTNASVRDYTLQASSPAINAGVVISGTTDGYVGSAPDMGQLEYAISPPPGGAPDPPVITTPAANGYNINGIVTIGGTAEDLSSVELFDGATSKGATNVVGGNWSISLPSVADGSHSYTAYATDSSLLTSTVSNTRVITVDTVRPRIASTSPINGATGVAVSANVIVTFDEAMNPLTITTSSFRVKKAGVPIAGSISMSGGNTVATFNPSPDMTALTGYIVELDATIKDVAGNALVVPQ